MIPQKPTIAAIIPTYRRGHYLVDTITALYRQSIHPDEIVVIDQTPLEEYSPEQVAWLQSENNSGRLRWVLLSPPAVSKARNRAVDESTADILLYLDDDVRLTPTLVEEHLKHYTSDTIAAVVGQVLPVDAERVKRLRPVAGDYETKKPLDQAFDDGKGLLCRPMRNIGFLYAGNLSIRRQTLLNIGGWDEHILNYGDRDLGLRIVAAGYRIDYDPAALLYHYGAPSGGTRVTDPLTPFVGWQRCVSIWYLAFRHLNGFMFLKYGVFRAARFSILLRANFLRPWRWPFEMFAFAQACYIARRWARRGMESRLSQQQ